MLDIYLLLKNPQVKFVFVSWDCDHREGIVIFVSIMIAKSSLSCDEPVKD